LAGFQSNLSALPARAYDECLADGSQIEIIEVDQANGWASINIISAAGISNAEISIDDHPMWIYEVDGRHIQPVVTDAISVFNGARYAAMIKLDKPVGSYIIRVANNGLNQMVSSIAVLRYKGATSALISNPSINYAGAITSASVRVFDETTIKPFPAIAPAQTADATYILSIDHDGAAWKWTLNGKDMYPMDIDTLQEPILFDPKQGLSPEITNLMINTTMGQWVDLIILVNAPSIQPPHPLHKHSTKAYRIGAGIGQFNYKSVAEAMQSIPGNFNLIDPPFRDGFQTIPNGQGPTWLAVRYQVTNPGVFLFHCRK
jgi:FtsP/CotA-like multicopper oxidase with cupredoxin domain